MREHHDHRERTVKQETNRLMSEVQILQETVKHPVASQDGFPRIATDEVAHPERDDHQLIEKFFARPAVKRQIVSERVAKKQRKQCHQSGDTHRSEKNL